MCEGSFRAPPKTIYCCRLPLVDQGEAELIHGSRILKECAEFDSRVVSKAAMQ